ncbi:hypothetical protein NMG60_11007258 [Bertholletia excelsa]
MAAISQYLSHLYAITTLFFTIIILELVILVRSVAGILSSSTKDRPITAARFLQLIEEKSPASRFSGGGAAFECAVCLSAVEQGEEIRELKCRHTFHKACLDTWLQQDWATCPLCRTKVLPEEIVVKFHQRLRDRPPEYDGSDDEFVFLLSALNGNNLHRLLWC